MLAMSCVIEFEHKSSSIRPLWLLAPKYEEWYIREYIYVYDVVPGPRDPCVVAAVDKFTWTTEILWRKRDGMATLWVREGERARDSPTPAWQAFIAFLGTLHQGWSSFTMYRFTVGDYLLQITKERMLLILQREGCNRSRGKEVELVTLHTWEV